MGPGRARTRGHVPRARCLPLPSLPSATAACPAERWTLLVPLYCIRLPTQLSFSCSQREGHECPWAAAPGRGPGSASRPPSGQGANAGYVLRGGVARTEWVGLPGRPREFAAAQRLWPQRGSDKLRAPQPSWMGGKWGLEGKRCSGAVGGGWWWSLSAFMWLQHVGYLLYVSGWG